MTDREEELVQVTLNDNIHIALDEYKILWDYYKETLEERRTLFEWYFKIIALPVTILVLLFSQAEQNEQYVSILGYILIIIFLSGLSMYLTYTSESVNATKYFRQIMKIRNYFKMQYPSLHLVFDVQASDRRGHVQGVDFIKIFKGLPIPIINSAIGALGFLLISGTLLSTLTLGIYLVFMIVHLFAYFLIFKLSKLE